MVIKSRKPKGPIVIKHKGTFSMYGYRTTDSASTRRKSLEKVAKAKGAGMVVKRLNAISILTRNRSPILSRKFRNDMKWVQKRFGTNKRKTQKKKNIKKSTKKSRKPKKIEKKRKSPKRKY